MTTLHQLQQGLERAWDWVSEGWTQLRQRADQALTRFQPSGRRDDMQTVADQAIDGAARWGLLAAEVRDEDDEVVVRLEAPGLESDDFELFAQGDMLVVRGEKRIERTQRQGAYHIRECAYGAFERAIPLPATVDDSRAKARYRRGVLHVRLPKTPAATRRRIDIKAD